MHTARFNQIFLALLLLSGICAFAVPFEYTNGLRGRVDGVFAPVAYPLRRVAQAVSTRLTPAQDNGIATPLADSRQEIDRLRSEVASLTVQIAELRQLNANRELGGVLRNYITPFKVFGGDQGRGFLTIQGSSFDGLAAGMAVVCREGLVGKISAAGPAGAQVRLITAKGFRVGGAFGRFADGRSQFVALGTPPPLVEGRGNGRMSVVNLTKKQVEEAGLVEGDWVVLRDPDDWLPILGGQLLGQVEHIEEQAKANLYVEITIKPRVNLDQLKEVLVVTGHPAAPLPARQPPPEKGTKAKKL